MSENGIVPTINASNGGNSSLRSPDSEDARKEPHGPRNSNEPTQTTRLPITPAPTPPRLESPYISAPVTDNDRSTRDRSQIPVHTPCSPPSSDDDYDVDVEIMAGEDWDASDDEMEADTRSVKQSGSTSPASNDDSPDRELMAGEDGDSEDSLGYETVTAEYWSDSDSDSDF